MSRAALAGEVGISESQLGVLERERDLPTLPTLKRVARYFDFTFEQVGRYVMESEGRACGPRRRHGSHRGA